MIDPGLKALAGKRIVLTRTPEQSDILVHKLKGSGAQIVVLPFVEFRRVEDLAPLDAALSRVAEFDWLVFTSQHAVQFFCERLRELGGAPMDLPASLRSVAIGVGTYNAALMERLRVEPLTFETRSGREFVRAFSPRARGRKVLLPQSDLAGPHIAEGLRKGGAQVTAIVAYRTCMPESLDREALARVRREGADIAVFASPSAFRNFSATVGEVDLKRFAATSAFAAIGPTTARAIREAGIAVVIEAEKPNSDEIIKAMIAHFSKAESVKARE